MTRNGMTRQGTTKLGLTGMMCALMALSACAERETILPGARYDARAVFSPDGPAVEGATTPASAALNLPAPRSTEWPQRAQNAQHLIGHAALGAGTTRVWSGNIGQASGRKARITADPIVAAGRVFAMDARARVTAFAQSGGTTWSTDITPAAESPTSASGGGLAFEGGTVFATSGYGELVALDAATGGIRWRQRLEAPVSAPPTVMNGVVYVVGRNATGGAVRAADGKVLWTVSGVAAPAGVSGVSSPATDGRTVIFPFASGQLLAVDAATGTQTWTQQVAGTRVGRAIALIRDITGDPVIAGNMVLGATSSGRIDALDRETGAQIWSHKDGAVSPPLVVGGSVFAVNDENHLVRLDAATGGRIFDVELPYYTDRRTRKQDRIIAHYGPVLAGGRLFVASSDGVLRAFDPRSGVLVGQGAIPGGAASAPVVGASTLYVASRNGQLHAFR